MARTWLERGRSDSPVGGGGGSVCGVSLTRLESASRGGSSVPAIVPPCCDSRMFIDASALERLCVVPWQTRLRGATCRRLRGAVGWCQRHRLGGVCRRGGDAVCYPDWAAGDGCDGMRGVWVSGQIGRRLARQTANCRRWEDKSSGVDHVGEAKNGSACGWRVGAKECCWRRSSITFVARFVVRQIYVWLGCSHRPRAAFSPKIGRAHV